jgi:hypothetical protein
MSILIQGNYVRWNLICLERSKQIVDMGKCEIEICF